MIVTFLITVLHEFSHGLSCKHFGGEVREIGFLLIYFHPAFYCDVSSAWQFPEKHKRLWVTFAGAWCELVCWSLAVLCWRVTQPDTWVHHAALIVVASSGIKSLFNLNPLIRLDGYYLLSDALEIPNLRQRSFQYLGQRLKRLTGRNTEKTERAAEEPSRNRRVYLLYGVLAGVYSFGLLGLLFVNVGDYLMETYQGVGFVLFCGLLVLFVGVPLFRRFRRRSATAEKSAETGTPRRWLRLAKLIVGTAALLAILDAWPMHLRISGDCTVLPAQKSTLRAEVEGTLQQVFVSEGQQVYAGQPVAMIANPQLQAEFDQVQAELRKHRAELEKLKTGATALEVELAKEEAATSRVKHEESLHQLREAEELHAAKLEESRAAVEQAQTQLDFETRNWRRVKRLKDRDAVTTNEFDEAEHAFQQAKQALELALAKKRYVEADELRELKQAVAVAACQKREADARLNLLLAGTRPEEIAAAEAVVAGLEIREKHLQSRLRKTTVVSPVAGVVTTRRPQEQRGNHLRPGDVIVEIQQLNQVEMEISLPEKEIGDVREGFPVSVKLRAYPEATLMSDVSAICPTTLKPDDRAIAHAEPGTVPVLVRLSNDKKRLMTGMTGKAKITCGRRSALELLTRRLARYIRVEFWSYW